MFPLYKMDPQMIYRGRFNNEHGFLIFSFAIINHENEGISDKEGKTPRGVNKEKEIKRG